MTLVAKLDKSKGRSSKRFIIGKPGGKISGSLYFKKGVPIPKELTMMFKYSERKGKKEKEEIEE